MTLGLLARNWQLILVGFLVGLIIILYWRNSSLYDTKVNLETQLELAQSELEEERRFNQEAQNEIRQLQTLRDRLTEQVSNVRNEIIQIPSDENCTIGPATNRALEFLREQTTDNSPN